MIDTGYHIPRVIGSGGGKSGSGGGGIQEDADTLYSVATARFVDLIGEGPIFGLVNAERSIYLDGVPLRSIEGTPAYTPFQFNASSRGTPDQGTIEGFVGTQQENALGGGGGVKIRKWTDVTKTTPFTLVREITDAGADAFRITISVMGLTSTDSKGKITGTKVEYEILCRVKGTDAWSVVKSGAIDGKSRSTYQESHEISLTSWPAGPYEISVKRVTEDSASSLLVNDLYWDSYTVMNYERFTYPHSALVAVALDARYFSNVPSRSYHVKGLIVRVPANYDPVTRIYASTGPGTTNGVWDGTWKLAYTNNPAWCFLDLLTSKRYGLGSRIASEGDTDGFGNVLPPAIDKWQLYKIAMYCDEMVPTGILGNSVTYSSAEQAMSTTGSTLANIPLSVGPTEPRFALNCVINTRDDAYKVVNQLASVFRGMVYWSAGMVALTQDAPGQAVMIFNNASAVDGKFNYEGSALTDRHTSALIGWNDPSQDFKQQFEYVEDRAGVLRYGYKQMEMVAFGCTTRTQARRVGLHLLYTERLEKEIVTFKTGINCAGLLPGEIVQIMDSHRTAARFSGRLAAGSTTSVTLDAAVTLTAGSYTLSVISVDGTLVSSPVTIGADGDYTVLSTNFPVAPVSNAVWSLASTSAKPFLARVLSIKEDKPGEYTVGCLEYNQSKFNAIDRGSKAVFGDYAFLSLGSIPAVDDLNVVEFADQPTAANSVGTSLLVSWANSKNPLVRGYVVVVIANGELTEYPETTRSSFTVQGVSTGSHIVRVYAVNSLGTRSTNYAQTLYTVIGQSSASDDVANLAVSVTDEGVVVTWDKSENSQWASTRLKLTKTGGSWEASEGLFEGKTTKYVMPFQQAGTYTVLAKHIMVGESESPAVASATVVINSPTEVPSEAISVDLSRGSALVRWPANAGKTTQPLAYYLIKLGPTTSDFSAAAEVARASGISSTQALSIATNGTKRVFIQPVDLGGNHGTPSYLDFLVDTEANLDTDPSPALADFDVTAGFASAWLTWEEPSYSTGGGYGGANVYRADWATDAPKPGFSDAIQAGRTFSGTANYIDPIGVGKRAVYWVKAFTRAGVEQTNPTPEGDGKVAQTTTINGQDLAPLAVEAENLANGAVSAEKLAAEAITLTAFASDIEPVGVITEGPLPTEKTTSVIVFGGKLYRWNGSAYESKFDAEDVVGVLTNEQIKEIDAAKVVGQLVADQIAQAAIEADKFASGIEPVTIVTGSTLPVVKSTSTVFFGGKLYRWSAPESKYVSNVDASDLTNFTGVSLNGANLDVDGVSIPIVEVAQNAAIPAISYIGEFATAPSTMGTKVNSVYKDLGDGNLYVLTGTPLAWELYLESGVDFITEIESTNGTVFRVGQARSTLLKAHVFKNGVEVTDELPESWFRWRRVSYNPQPAPNDDATWNSGYSTGYKAVSVNVDDVLARATFHCDILKP